MRPVGARRLLTLRKSIWLKPFWLSTDGILRQTDFIIQKDNNNFEWINTYLFPFQISLVLNKLSNKVYGYISTTVVDVIYSFNKEGDPVQSVYTIKVQWLYSATRFLHNTDLIYDIVHNNNVLKASCDSSFSWIRESVEGILATAEDGLNDSIPRLKVSFMVFVLQSQ